FLLPQLGSGESIRLRFWHWFSTYPQDKGVVEVSADNGVTWASVSQEFFGNSLVWSRYEANITTYQHSTIRFAFHFTSDGSAVADGWSIDDIEVVRCPAIGACQLIPSQPPPPTTTTTTRPSITTTTTTTTTRPTTTTTPTSTL